ncbi:MAG TPA: flavin reductase family protein [Desulfomicrobiaceae bacterium]|nr:flavin reductase family protein [Desulfomicrobiaceae bacterium]
MKKSLGSSPLAQPAPAWIVGSYDAEGKPNAATIGWGGICCSKPACLTISLQKQRYSYENIMARGAYTVSIPSVQYVKEADYFGIVSGKNTDKFAATGLTPVASEVVDAPYVGEFPLIFECKVVNTVELGVHIQFVGEIVDIKADESVLDEKGVPDILKVDPVVFAAGRRGYHRVGELVGDAFSCGKAFK